MFTVMVLLGLLLPVTAAAAIVHARPGWIRAGGSALRHRFTAGLDRVRSRLPEPVATTVWIAGWLLTLLAVVTAVGHLLRWVGRGNTTGLDRALLEVFHRGRLPWSSTVWSGITLLGDTVFLVTAALALGLLWRRRHGNWFALHLLGGAYLGAAALFNAAKRLVGRGRPAAELALHPETGMAFPSGHATDAAAFYVALALLAITLARSWRGRVVWASATAAVVLLVATSRLYLAAHWVTDVVAGTVLGTAWAAVVWLTLTSRQGPYGRRGSSPDRGAGAGASAHGQR